MGQAIISELLGAILIVFMYLTQTEEKTKLTNDPALTTLLISAAFISGQYVGFVNETQETPSPLNPAIATSLILGQLFRGQFNNMSMTWVYVVFPWVGGLLSILIFECAYKKQAKLGERSEEAVDHDDFREQFVEQEEELITPS